MFLGFRILMFAIIATTMYGNAGAVVIGSTTDSGTVIGNASTTDDGVIIGNVTEYDLTMMNDAEKLQMVSTLDKDLAILSAELKKCQKQKKGWTAATVIGAVGVVATGVAAGVQGAKIKSNKESISGLKSEVSSKESELKNLNGGN